MEDRTHTLKSDLDFLKASALNIKERLECDTVHIFMTRHIARKDLTEMREIGVGNTLARQKQIELWAEDNSTDIVWSEDGE